MPTFWVVADLRDAAIMQTANVNKTGVWRWQARFTDQA
jgi:hypothetical protein